MALCHQIFKVYNNVTNECVLSNSSLEAASKSKTSKMGELNTGAYKTEDAEKEEKEIKGRIKVCICTFNGIKLD